MYAREQRKLRGDLRRRRDKVCVFTFRVECHDKISNFVRRNRRGLKDIHKSPTKTTKFSKLVTLAKECFTVTR